MWELWIAFIWLRIGSVTGCYEHGNEPSGYIKDGEILDYRNFYQLVEKGRDRRSRLVSQSVSHYMSADSRTDWYRMNASMRRQQKWRKVWDAQTSCYKNVSISHRLAKLEQNSHRWPGAESQGGAPAPRWAGCNHYCGVVSPGMKCKQKSIVSAVRKSETMHVSELIVDAK
jgi:alkylated DNA nucleotide flippase Atl1